MGTTKLPNELECLAARLANGMEELVDEAQGLPLMFAAVNAWAPDLKTPDAAADMLLGARALQFDAVRLAALVQTHDTALRRLHSQTLYLVDNLRLAGANPGPAAAPFLSAGLETLADMQDALQDLFPGDTCISS